MLEKNCLINRLLKIEKKSLSKELPLHIKTRADAMNF